jgi:hypothetical protein
VQVHVHGRDLVEHVRVRRAYPGLVPGYVPHEPVRTNINSWENHRSARKVIGTWPQVSLIADS